MGHDSINATLRAAIGAALLLCFACIAPAQDKGAPKAPALPVPTTLPPGNLGKIVALGRDIVNRTSTHPLSRQYVGNSLNCSSCHLDGGTNPKALSFLGVASAYPTFAPREKQVITLEDRNLNCFMRSMNGTRPPNGGELSVALAAYITWLSEGYPIKMSLKGPFGPNSQASLAIDPDSADVGRGKTLYAAKCASCHGLDGAGVDANPPVWGPKSYNSGAGMADDLKHATYIKSTMPLGDPDLSDKDALDIAAYVNDQPRPEFKLEEHLGK